MGSANTYIVYRIAATGQRIPIGEVVERRRSERKDNIDDILRLAKKMYSSSTFEALDITVEPRDVSTPVPSGGRSER